jgi:hypothetical protein
MRALLCVASLFLIGLLGGNGPAVADVSLSQPWYYTEVIVFQRPGVQEHSGEESLVRHRGARLPLALHLLADDPLTRPEAIDPVTRSCLTYPVLTLLPPTRRWQDEPDDRDHVERLDARPVPAINPHLAPDAQLDYLRALRAFENTLTEQSYRWLAPDTFTLRGQAQRLTRGGHQVLLHGRWLQPVPPRERPEALLVRAGPRYGDEYALEGIVDVTLARFLHFRAHLTYREPLLGRAPVDWAFAPGGGDAAPAAAAADTVTAVPLRPLTMAELASAGYLLLDESRRMRSAELHYLDHPKLGILVRIDPVPIPAELSDAREAAKERR